MYRRVLWLLVIVAELARRRHEAAEVVVAAVLLLEAPARDIDASGLASVGLGDVGRVEVADGSCPDLIVGHRHARFSRGSY